MEENVLLALFITLPLVFLCLFYLLLLRNKEADRQTVSLPKIIAGNILVLLFLVSIAVLGAECYYRFLYDTTDSFEMTKTAKRWFKRYYQLNIVGTRDNTDDYSIKSDHSRLRITFFGDSITAGHGIKNVDDRFANVIRSRCPECEIHVFAGNGYDTGYELSFVETLLEAGYDFDVVVLVYCLNDVGDIMPEWIATQKRIFVDTTPGFLFKNSYFGSMLYYRFIAAREPDIADYFQSIKKGYQGDIWDQQKKRLMNIYKLVSGRGGRLAVVTFPFLHALGPAYPYKEIHAQLTTFWASLGVPHLDLYDLYAGYKPVTLMVNSHDAHPNEFAHRFAAQKILAFLKAQFP